ncbi:uncharacterized protein ISCGN_016757 [Ixodes scapularis]
MHPTLVGILLVLGYYCLQEYVASDASEEFKDGRLSSGELKMASDIRSRLGNGSAWKRTHQDLYVCTAYLDDRTRPALVRFVGVANASGHGYSARRRFYPSFECVFAYRNKTSLETSQASWNVLGELGNENMESVLVTCPLQGIEPLPDLTSLVYYNSDPVVYFTLRRLRWNVRKVPFSVGLCVSPSGATWSDVRAVAEFVAYYGVLGVRQFYFYVYAATPEVLDFLLDLKNRLHLNISFRIWRGLPTSRISEVADGAFINDCILRYVPTSTEYVLTASLNEFVSLRRVATLQDLLASAPKATALTFLSYPFYGQRPSATELITQTNVLRSSLVEPPGLTSRVLVKARLVMEAGSRVAFSLHDAQRHLFDPEEACLHRYDLVVNTRATSTEVENTELDSHMRKLGPKLYSSPVWQFWLNRQQPRPTPLSLLGGRR